MTRSLAQYADNASKIDKQFYLITGRNLYMRKLLILQSLFHAAGMPVSYHKHTVRLQEHMIALQIKKMRGAR